MAAARAFAIRSTVLLGLLPLAAGCSRRTPTVTVTDGVLPDAPRVDRSLADRTADGGGRDQRRLQAWVKRFGDTGIDGGAAVVVDNSGNVYIAGYFSGSVDFGGGPLVGSSIKADLFLASLGPEGAHRWSKRLGPAGDLAGSAWLVGLATDASGDLYVSGATDGPLDLGAGPVGSGHLIYLASFTTGGGHRWSKVVNAGNSPSAGALAVDGAGHVYIAGCFDGSIDLGGGPLESAGQRDILLARLTAQGGHAWSKRLGGEGSDCARSIVVDAAGNLYLAGELEGTIDLGGGPLVAAWSRDPFLASFTSAGAHRWSKTLGPLDALGWGSLAWGAGSLFIAGGFEGTVNFGGGALSASAQLIAASLTPAGAHRWSKEIGMVTHQGIAVDPAGHVFFCGDFDHSSFFGGTRLDPAGLEDAFFASYSGSGSPRWAKRFGGPGPDGATAVAAAPDGSLYVTGAFSQTATFEGVPLTSAGARDIFLLKLVPPL